MLRFDYINQLIHIFDSVQILGVFEKTRRSYRKITLLYSIKDRSQLLNRISFIYYSQLYGIDFALFLIEREVFFVKLIQVMDTSDEFLKIFNEYRIQSWINKNFFHLCIWIFRHFDINAQSKRILRLNYLQLLLIINKIFNYFQRIVFILMLLICIVL